MNKNKNPFIKLLGFFYYICFVNNIDRVSEVLANPRQKLNLLYDLCKELCNHTINLNCSSCITEGVMLLSNWLKSENAPAQDRSYFTKAVNGDYELKRLVLFVQIYDCGNEERQKELDACLRINKERKHFSEVVEITERLTYSQLFKLTENYKDSINVIANSDIYFDETILLARFMTEQSCYALSRWDYNGTNLATLFNRKDSQDAWVFNGQVKECRNADFNLGVAGCDNRIAHELKQAGYYMMNPSKTIHAIHLHMSNLRTYDNKIKVQEPYHFIHPHF